MGAMSLLSVHGAFALPESSNPFAMNSGGGCSKAVVNLATMAATLIISSPIAVAAWWLDGSAWVVLLLLIGVAYGVSGAVLGAYLAGKNLDRRGPELLAAVTPSR
jgi:ABC-2 type transport system permease protein